MICFVSFYSLQLVESCDAELHDLFTTLVVLIATAIARLCFDDNDNYYYSGKINTSV